MQNNPSDLTYPTVVMWWVGLGEGTRRKTHGLNTFVEMPVYLETNHL